MNTGKVVQVLGPVVDVIFEDGELPEIFTALEINTESTGKLICEVQQHLGENTVRTVSMGAMHQTVPFFSEGRAAGHHSQRPVTPAHGSSSDRCPCHPRDGSTAAGDLGQ